MPVTLEGNRKKSRMGDDVFKKDFGYEYPEDLDLRPGSKFHDFLKDKIMERAQASHRVMSKYKDRWYEIDKVLRVYVPPEKRKTAKSDQKRREKQYADLIIPESYATKETILTYYMSAFMQNPIWQYEGVGPEDVVGAKLLTHLIDHQAQRARMGLNLHTMFEDDTKYGFGVVAPKWRRYYGRKPRVRQFGFDRGDIFEITREERIWEENALLYEGNELENINPYLYLPDVSVPIHKPEQGEYVGWVEETTSTALLEIERDPNSLIFNAKYLRELDARSQYTVVGKKQNTRERYQDANDVARQADLIWMYVDLIPQEWKLGDSDQVEKWLFAVGGDRVINSAQRVDYMHGRTPVAVCASNFDGYSATPVSKLAMVHDIQTLINFMYTSHVRNVRKALNDMFIMDPSIINYYDVINPEPGKVIRTRRAAWGNQALDHAFKQLDVRDVTQQHVAEGQQLGQLMRRISATDSALQGGIGGDGRTTRISAREAGGAIGAALSRFQKNAQLIDMQAMQPLAFMMAMHVQQYMEKESFVKITGGLAEDLLEDFADQNQRMPISPYDLMIEFDVMPTNGQVPGSEDPQVWTQLFQIAASNPIIAQQLDWIKLFKHMGRNLGAKNVDDFIVKVQPDQQVLQQAAEGNAITQEQAMAG